eukprot:EG_transcript_5106
MLTSLAPSWAQPIRESPWKAGEGTRPSLLPTTTQPSSGPPQRPASAELPNTRVPTPQRVRPATAGTLRATVQDALHLPPQPRPGRADVSPTHCYGLRGLRELRDRHSGANVAEVAWQPSTVSPSSALRRASQEGSVVTTVPNAPLGRAVVPHGPVFLPHRDAPLFRQAAARFFATEGLAVAADCVHVQAVLEGGASSGSSQTLVQWSVGNVPITVLTAVQQLLTRSDVGASLEHHFTEVGLCRPAPLLDSASPSDLPSAVPQLRRSPRPASAAGSPKLERLGGEAAPTLPAPSRRALRSLFTGPHCISPKLRRIRRAQQQQQQQQQCPGGGPAEAPLEPVSRHRQPGNVPAATAGSGPSAPTEPDLDCSLCVVFAKALPALPAELGHMSDPPDRHTSHGPPAPAPTATHSSDPHPATAAPDAMGATGPIDQPPSPPHGPPTPPAGTTRDSPEWALGEMTRQQRELTERMERRRLQALEEDQQRREQEGALRREVERLLGAREEPSLDGQPPAEGRQAPADNELVRQQFELLQRQALRNEQAVQAFEEMARAMLEQRRTEWEQLRERIAAQTKLTAQPL